MALHVTDLLGGAGCVAVRGVGRHDKVVARLEAAEARGVPHGKACRVAVPDVAGGKRIPDCDTASAVRFPELSVGVALTLVEFLSGVVLVDVLALAVLSAGEVLNILQYRLG